MPVKYNRYLGLTQTRVSQIERKALAKLIAKREDV